MPGRGQSHRQVLLVEDDADCASMIRDVLEQDPALAVAHVRDGSAALEWLKEHEPDVILLDLRLPVTDGSSFVAQYRTMAPAPVPIILVSGVQKLALIARELGAWGYLTKPFDLEALESAVRLSRIASPSPAGERRAATRARSTTEPSDRA